MKDTYCPTGVPRSWETAPPWDPRLVLCPGPYGGPGGGGCFLWVWYPCRRRNRSGPVPRRSSQTEDRACFARDTSFQTHLLDTYWMGRWRVRSDGQLCPYPEYSRANSYPWSPSPPRRAAAPAGRHATTGRRPDRPVFERFFYYSTSFCPDSG